MVDITPENVARMLNGVTPTAWKYRWKIDGEYVQWRYSDASNFHRSLDGFEEVPLYSAEALSARLAVDAKAHEKEIAVWSENYAALERKVAEVEAERDSINNARRILNVDGARLQDRAEAAEAENAKLRDALADAAGALDGAGEELSDFANVLSREPWHANHAYESAVQARAALQGATK